jgi:hypothetical protein
LKPEKKRRRQEIVYEQRRLPMEKRVPHSEPGGTKKRRNSPSMIQKRKPFMGEIPLNKKYCPECATLLDVEAFTSHTGKIRKYCILNVQPLSIDHCHKTEKVRALLCAQCNTAFGLMKENPENIQALLDSAQK